MEISKDTIKLLTQHSSVSSYPKCLKDWSFIIHISKPETNTMFSSVNGNELQNGYFYVSKFDGKVIVLSKDLRCWINEKHNIMYTQQPNYPSDLDDCLYWFIREIRGRNFVKSTALNKYNYDEYIKMCNYVKLCQYDTLDKKIKLLTDTYKLNLWRSQIQLEEKLMECKKDIGS